MNDLKKTDTGLIVQKDRKKEQLPVYFTDQELNRFFNTIDQNKKYRDYVFFLTLLGTGKRISEILAIKKNNIDLHNRTIKIKTLKKRRLSEQNIRINQKLAYFISIYIGRLRAEDLIFNFSRQYADSLIKKYGKKAAINYKRLSCHIFRHTFAVKWLEQGLPIHKLKKHLGHSHISSTLIYTQIVDTDYFKTVDEFNIFSFVEENKD